MTRRRRVLAVVYGGIVCTALAIPGLVGTAAAASAPVIAPGQEELLAAMVGKGAALPEGCKLTGGDVEYHTVKATYACLGGEVVFELTHPAKAARSATLTERFALQVRSGSPPAGLAAAIEQLIRAREAGFEWTMLEVKPEPASARWPALAGAALVAATIAGWALWRRRSAAPSAPQA
ncbi:hypothetical protein L6Q96_21900 [Candidatus Binatia bacterium]|nr:hypothetical protein [Candidatus Binatia bacterium]